MSADEPFFSNSSYCGVVLMLTAKDNLTNNTDSENLILISLNKQDFI